MKKIRYPEYLNRSINIEDEKVFKYQYPTQNGGPTLKKKYPTQNRVIIAQWLARLLTTAEVPGSDTGKGENLLISD